METEAIASQTEEEVASDGADRVVTLAIAASNRARAKNVARAWGEWVKAFTTHELRGDRSVLADERLLASVKNGPCFMAGPIKDETAGKTRSNMVEAQVITLDLDEVTAEQLAEVQRVLAAHEYVAYSTYSHDPENGRFRLRFVLPLAKPIAAEDYEAIWRRFQLLVGGVNDEHTKNVNRLNYMPSTFDLAVAEKIHNVGKWIGEENLPAPPSEKKAPKSFDSVRPKSTRATIREGSRNATLLSLAGTMRRAGSGVAAIFAALQVENETRCKPPIDEDEVRMIAQSAGRYEPEDNVFGDDEVDAALLRELGVQRVRRSVSPNAPEANYYQIQTVEGAWMAKMQPHILTNWANFESMLIGAANRRLPDSFVRMPKEQRPARWRKMVDAMLRTAEEVPLDVDAADSEGIVEAIEEYVATARAWDAERSIESMFYPARVEGAVWLKIAGLMKELRGAFPQAKRGDVVEILQNRFSATKENKPPVMTRDGARRVSGNVWIIAGAEVDHDTAA